MCARAFLLYSRALLFATFRSVVRGLLGCCSWLIMAPEAFAPAFALAFAFACSRSGCRCCCSDFLGCYCSFMPGASRGTVRVCCSSDDRGTGCTSWLLVVAFALACSRSASMQKPCSAFCVVLCSFLQKYLLFRLFYTQKRTKCALFRIFCAKYLAVSKKSITFAASNKKNKQQTQNKY